MMNCVRLAHLFSIAFYMFSRVHLYMCVCSRTEQNEYNWYNHRLMENTINVVGIQFQNQFATHREYIKWYTIHVTIPFFAKHRRKNVEQNGCSLHCRQLNWPYSIYTTGMCHSDESLLFLVD